MQQQAVELSAASTRNQLLRDTAARTTNSSALSEAQIKELLKLRNEIGHLQDTLKQIASLQHEVERLNVRLNDVASDQAAGRDDYRALLQDEMPRRRARVVQFKKWLDDNPQEKIPGLASLPDNDWIDRVADPLITDEDYQSAASRVRARLDLQFAGTLFNALKQFGQANNGQFPTDLSQLQPYFTAPVDPAMLARFEIVPANSLCAYLAELGGNSLITEKAPINEKLDPRCAIGMTDYRQTIYIHRWDQEGVNP